MENQVLSIERMRHLQELGVELGKTLLYWARSKDNNPRAATHYGKWILTKGNSAQVVGMTSWEFVPAFTLQDIIEMLPESIMGDKNETYKGTVYWYYLSITTSWIVSYDDGKGIFEPMKCCRSRSLLEAAYNMLCWCAENGYLKGEKE